MESPKKFNRNEPVDIKEYYSLNIKALWKGLKQEHISLWMLCIYFFFEYVRPQTLYPELDILPWGQTFLILTVITATLDKSIHWVSYIENKLLFVFCIILILSGIFAFNPSVSWDYKNTMFGWVVVYFLVITVVNTEKRLILFILAYLLFSLKMAQHGAISWAMRGFSFASYGLVGSPGWFRNSGEYAIQMLIYGSLAIAFVVPLKNYWGRYKKWFLYVLAAMGYMAVMGASSRGSQIALAMIGIWMLLKQKSGFKGLVILAIISFALYAVLPEEQMQRFREIGEDNNSLQRLAYWKIGLQQIIPEHLFLGVGYHNWVSYLDFLYPQGVGVMGIIQECHNIYIQAASELGILGLFVFLFMAIFGFIANANTRKFVRNLDNKFLFYLSYGLDAGLLGYLVAGSFVTVLYYPFFWIQIAMIVALYNVARNLGVGGKLAPSRHR